MITSADLRSQLDQINEQFQAAKAKATAQYNEGQSLLQQRDDIIANIVYPPNLTEKQRTDYATRITMDIDDAISEATIQVKLAVAEAQRLQTEGNNLKSQYDTLLAEEQQTMAVEESKISSEDPAAIRPGDQPYIAGVTDVPGAGTFVIDIANPRQTESTQTELTANESDSDPLGNAITEIQSGRYYNADAAVRASQSPMTKSSDTRIRISLAPSADYLYKIAKQGDILYPLAATNGVIFPYAPQINVTYSAQYTPQELTHSNYKTHTYRGSSVDNISITGDFTAQDSNEANYLLAVMHFFKSVTKMFYGQDQNPARGVPPPLVYLSGYGQYQFDMHPMAVTNFTMNLPADVDYINAYPVSRGPESNRFNMQPFGGIVKPMTSTDRLMTLFSSLTSGNRAATNKNQSSPNGTQINKNTSSDVTKVPSKIQIQIQCIPIVTRSTMSNQFSLKEYATGSLMLGSSNFNKTGGGIW